MGIQMSELLMTTDGYYQDIGRHDAGVLGHSIEELIASCYMNVFDGFAVSIVRCNELAEIVRVSNPRLFNCYTIAANISSRKFISGYSLVVHLDNTLSTPYNYLSSPYEFSKSLGLVLVPHMHGTKAWFERTAIHIHPGKHTDIKLHLEETKLKEPPYGDCEDILYLRDNRHWKYSVQACVSDCLERLVVEVGALRNNVITWTVFPNNWPFMMGNPLDTGVFPSQRVTSVQFWCFVWLEWVKNASTYEMVIKRFSLN